MKNILIPIIATAVLTTTAFSAFAQHRRHHHGYSHRPPVVHHLPRRHWHHNRRQNVAPYIAGAIGAAIIGGIIYDQYGRRCVREVVGYDYYGQPITRRVCD